MKMIVVTLHDLGTVIGIMILLIISALIGVLVVIDNGIQDIETSLLGVGWVALMVLCMYALITFVMGVI